MRRALLLVAIAAAAWSCRPSEYRKFSGLTMGTIYNVTVRLSGGKQLAEVRSAVEEELAKVNGMMSMFLPGSEISRFNASASRNWFAVSRPLFLLLRKAREVSEKSGGAFDVTVKPLVDLWGFGTKGKRSVPPTPEEIAAARARIGFRKLVLHPERALIRKEQPDLMVDLSAIAKGCGVDLVAERLRAMGIADFLVEIGGEVYAAGRNPAAATWKIAISDPSRRGYRRVVAFSDWAVATSGSYENYFEWQGKSYSHTIDPATGWPIGPEVVSVSVLAKTCMEADAWATACDVLGAARSFEIAARERLPLFLIIRAEAAGGYRDQINDLFREYLRDENSP